MGEAGGCAVPSIDIARSTPPRWGTLERAAYHRGRTSLALDDPLVLTYALRRSREPIRCHA